MNSGENRQYFELPVELSEEDLDVWAIEVWKIVTGK